MADVSSEHPSAASGSAWQVLGGLIRPHRRALGGLGAALAAATALPLAGPLILRAFIDRATGDAGGTGGLATLAIVYALLGVAASGAQVLVGWRATSLTWEVTNELRHDLAEHVLHADLRFFRDTTPGELITRIDDDVTAMNEFISKFVVRLVSVGLIAVASLVVVVIVEPVLAVPMAAFVAVTVWVVIVQRDRAIPESMAERAASAEVMGYVEEAVAGVDDLATLRAGPFAVARLAERSESLLTAAAARCRAQMRMIGVVRVVLVIGQMAMLAFGGAAFGLGWITLGTAFLGYRFVSIVTGPVEMLAWQLQDLQGAGGAARRVGDLLAQRSSVRRGDRELPPGPLDLRLRDVTLVYDDGDSEVLSGVDLDLRAGQRLGVLGRSGSGKTSLARLVLGLIEPTRGSITLGGIELAEVAEGSLRRRVAAVPQDVQLFPGTVRDNVTLYDDRHDDARVIAALHQVGLADWLASQPEGLETTIGGIELTAGMSAGEAQLLAFARAFLQAPDVVVLDEATSRVDPATQARLQHAGDLLLDGRAAMIIAHRLETLAGCDRLVVLEDGAVVEQGDRVTLAADPTSHYARLLARAGGGLLVDAAGELG